LYSYFDTKAIYLPNIHSYQFDDNKNNTQYVLMTERQFYYNLFSGDGNMVADVVLLSGGFEEPLFLCSGYKVIKGYLGVARRDLKLHGNNDKKKFHALRSMYMAEKLMEKELPTVGGIQLLYKNYAGCYLPSTETLNKKQNNLRGRLNDMLNKGEIDMYPHFREGQELIQIVVDTNNIKEFKYD
jgi:hypothetical protein